MNRDEIKRIVDDCEKKCVEQFQLIDDINFYYSEKVLNAMQESGLSESSFSSTTGYGYNDIGRDTIENIYKKSRFKLITKKSRGLAVITTYL